ncbi:hypothetical protein R1flu_018630 [Riccia fluitans]|uniref:Ubiquitin-like protease family profile domain-containing protein n=1 Tax=Riccia fluitans TaxID=41844 RepID=A0ABD1ZGL8_9MARC
MKIKKDGHLVEPLDLDVDAKSQKTPKKKQTGSEQPSRKHLRFESDPKDGNEGNLPSVVKTSRKEKRKVIESSHRSDVDTDLDIPAEKRRMLKIGMTASCLEMDPPLLTPTGQTSGRGSNHIPVGDTTKEVCNTSSKLPSDGILEQSVSKMTTMLSNIVEHHGHANQRLASLEEDLAHAKLEEEKLKATIQALEKEKSEMNAKVALMERKDLYDLLEAKMEGFQIANHPGTIGGFENLNLTVTKKWVEIPMLNLEEFEKCPTDFLEYALLARGWDGWKQICSICQHPLGFLPSINSGGLDADDFSMDKFFGLQDPTCPDDVRASPDFEEDLRTNERLRLQAKIHLPHPLSQIVPVLALVDLTQYTSSSENKGSEDQGWPGKKDLTKVDLESTMYKGRYLRGDVINMYINEAFLKKPREQLHNMFYVNTFWFTKASELMARYDKTNHAEKPMIKITCLRKSICPELHDEDMRGNLPAWIFMPIHGKNHWSLAIIRLHNDVAMLAHLDSSQGTHDPKAIFHVFKTVLCLIVPIDPALIMMAIMNLEQQQDGHSCGKHVLQMLAGAAMKESDGLDRYFREEGLIRYIATLDQVRSFDVVFGMYLSGKMAGPSM